MWLFLSLFIAILLTAAIIYYTLIYAPGYDGPISDHFDGKRFFNPWPTEERTRGDLFKWMRNRQIGPWPEYVSSLPGPPPPERVGKGRLRATFINHATVLIQMDNLNILTDPIWAKGSGPVDWTGPRRVQPPGIRFEDLPPIDYVIIGHNHYDHLNIPTLKRLQKKSNPLIIAGLGNSKLLKKKGLKRAKDLDWWESIKLSEDVILTSVPSQHFSGRGLFDQNRTLWMGFILEGNIGRIYNACDTGWGPHIKQIRERFAPIHFAILPIGAYKPRWFMSLYHLSPEEAVKAHQVLEATTSMGMHFRTFAGLADDGFDEAVNELQQALDKAGIPHSQFWILNFGEGRDVPSKPKQVITN